MESLTKPCRLFLGPVLNIGYASKAYAQSYGEYAHVVDLPASGGHLLRRPIPGSPLFDLASSYPIFSCADWHGLAADIAGLASDIVALAVVPDCFCPISEADLRQLFRIVRPLSPHYIIDLGEPPAPSKHHRRKLRQAPSDIDIAVVADPMSMVTAWNGLYGELIRRHDIRGLRRFSPAIFAAQLQVPGAVLIAAQKDGRVLGIDWYYHNGPHVFAHLSAYSEEGYAHSVSYPMMAAGIAHFASRAEAIDIGGVPLLSSGQTDGMGAFKAGWATRPLPSFFCGSDLLPDAYRRISGGRSSSESEFFPHYRASEFQAPSGSE